MVESGPFPLRGVMAGRTCLGKSSRLMIRIGCLIVIVQMTGSAIVGGAGEPVIEMALGTGDGDMRTSQGEPSCCIVIKPPALPLCCSVAQGTVSRKSSGCVVGIAGLIEGRLVTTDALGGRG